MAPRKAQARSLHLTALPVTVLPPKLARRIRRPCYLCYRASPREARLALVVAAAWLAVEVGPSGPL